MLRWFESGAPASELVTQDITRLATLGVQPSARATLLRSRVRAAAVRVHYSHTRAVDAVEFFALLVQTLIVGAIILSSFAWHNPNGEGQILGLVGPAFAVTLMLIRLK